MDLSKANLVQPIQLSSLITMSSGWSPDFVSRFDKAPKDICKLGRHGSGESNGYDHFLCGVQLVFLRYEKGLLTDW